MTYKQKYNWRALCKESLDQVENYQQAKADNFVGWCMHHRVEIQPDGTRVSMQELKDKGLYYGRPASELIFMRFGDHSALHSTRNTYMKGKHHSAETRKKISESAKGKTFSEEHRQKLSEAKKGKNNPFFGKHLSEETRQKMSEAQKGKHKSAEHRQKLSEAAKGKNNWTKDLHWWNNDIEMKMSRECPGPEWKRGRLKVSMTSL